MVALSARTGGSRHTGLAALPHENNQYNSRIRKVLEVLSPDKALSTEKSNLSDMNFLVISF